LLIQLSRKNLPDVEALLASCQNAGDPSNTPQLGSCEGVTIIMACRSMSRAQVARKILFALLDADIKKQKKQPGYDGHADSFRQNVKIDVLCLDLAVMKSVFDFGDQLCKK
jgi:3-keto steroid reductase